MTELIIERTPKTPLIDLNHLTGDLIFSGRSIPENAAKVYEPVLDWVTDYIREARPTTNLRLDLEYFNTSSTIWLAKILKSLSRINNPEFVIFINLYLPVEEFDEMNEFEDIREAFYPLTDIFLDSIPSIGIKLHGTDNNGSVIRDTMVLIDHGQLAS